MKVINQNNEAAFHEYTQLSFTETENQRSGSRIGNSGLTCLENDWIYYSCFSDSGKLYKWNTISNENIKICEDSAHSINVLDGWIYYNAMDSTDNKSLGIYKIRTDGTGRTKLSSSKGWFIQVVGDWIYGCAVFEDEPSKTGLYKMRIDGSEKQNLKHVICQHLCVVKKNIYYTTVDTVQNQYGLFKLDIDTMKVEKLGDSMYNSVIVSDEWIYYSTIEQKKLNNVGIYKMRTDGSELTKISGHKANRMIINDGIIYFTGDGGIQKIKIDGTDHQQLVKARILSMSILKDHIYYDFMDDHNICRSKRIHFNDHDMSEAFITDGSLVQMKVDSLTSRC